MTEKARKVWFPISLAVIGVLAVLCVILFIQLKKEKESTKNQDSVTFYAEITDKTDNTLTVRGLEVNDVNYRGEFFFSPADSMKLTWRGTQITLDDLQEGDRISITFSGYVLETYPGQLTDVTKVQLLEDEK